MRAREGGRESLPRPAPGAARAEARFFLYQAFLDCAQYFCFKFARNFLCKDLFWFVAITRRTSSPSADPCQPHLERACAHVFSVFSYPRILARARE